MATPPQLTHIAFANGIDESIEPEVLDPSAAFAVMQNGRQDRRGGYAKRLGFGWFERNRFDGTVRTTGARLFAHVNQSCVADGTQCDVYDEDKALWKKTGRLPECGVRTRMTPSIGSNLLDSVLCNGYVVIATHVPDNGSERLFAHVETVDGVVVRAPERVGSGVLSGSAFNGVLGTYGNIVIAVFGPDNVADLVGWYLDCSTATSLATGWQTLGNVVTDKTTTGTGAYLFSSQSLSASVAIAYVNGSGGASQVTVKLLTSAGVGTTQTVNTSSVKPNSVGLGGSTADRLYVAWNESTDIKMIGLNPTTLATSSTTAVIMSSVASANVACPYITPTGTGVGWVAVKSSASTEMIGWTAAAAMAPSGTQNDPFAFFQARPFVRSSRLYGLFASEPTNGQGHAILGDWTDTNASPGATPTIIRPIATAYPGQIRMSLGQQYSQPLSFGNDVYGYAVLVQRAASETRSVALVLYDFADAGRWDSASEEATTFLSGGILSALAGTTLSEAAFLHAPPAPSLTQSSTGLTGTFSYVSVYETIDGAGNLVTSAVSVPASISVTNKSILVATPPLTLTSRITESTDYRVRISHWRTEDGGAAPYYFLGSRSIDTTGTNTNFTDAVADATLVTRRKLYGTGNLPGENGSGLNKDAPPYATDVVTFNGMVVVLSGPVLWWSAQQVDGEARWWNNEFQSQVPGNGDGVALTVQDGTLYVFKADRIYSYGGDPPNDNGSFGGLGLPRLLSSDVGCVNKRSICTCGLGVFFQSARGIELLERSGAVSWVGEKVQETLAAYPTVTSAVLDSRNSLVRIALTDGFAGRTLVYDLTLRTWVSVDLINGSFDEEASADASMVYVDGAWRYGWLGDDGYLWYERDEGDSDAYLDGDIWIDREAETGSFKVSGIQGKQFLNRLLVLERYATDHNLEVSLAYNYETSFRAARTWTRAEINGLLSDGWPITQLRHDAHDDAECQSVRVRLVETAPTGGTVGSGKGGTWLALTLDLTPKPGTFDVPEGAV